MKIAMKSFLIIGLAFWAMTACKAQKPESMKTITENGMTVHWNYKGERIYFEMNAPTDGWVTIGFNTQSGMTEAYLLMGHIVNGVPNVVEHYTSSPGEYQSIQNFDVLPQVENIEGEEQGSQTVLRFSLPVNAVSKYQKELSENLTYSMILAYSREDDFQHHSMMRTAVDVKL